MKIFVCPLYPIEHYADYGVFKCSFLHDTIQSDKMLAGPVVLEIEN
jgi:Na+/pantothenate symporter